MLEPYHEVLTVTQLNKQTRYLLESQFAQVQVEGEISNLATPASGHIYFTLKDEKAQVRCAMFRFSVMQLSFRPEEGMQVVLTAKVSIYEARGDYQLIAERMSPAGEGLLSRQFEYLKQKLRAEGLFEQSHKKPLPQLSKTIGVITSPTGAVIRDILTVLKRRYPLAEIIIYPSRVQGKEAAQELINALQLANQRRECDCLILARGGGSLEDLWPFNEEALARAIFNSELPIISAVGHETDVTIADFVADLRAPTPSAAAELVCPDWAERWNQFTSLQQRSVELIQKYLKDQEQVILWLKRNLRHPKQSILFMSQRTDELSGRLLHGISRQIQRKRLQVDGSIQRLVNASPTKGVTQHKQNFRTLNTQLCYLLNTRLESLKAKLENYTDVLEVIGPMATVKRGYAIVTTESGEVVKDASMFNGGEEIKIRLAKGQLKSSVTEVIKNA